MQANIYYNLYHVYIQHFISTSNSKKDPVCKKKGGGERGWQTIYKYFQCTISKLGIFFVNMDANNDLETLMNIISKISLDD